jgi:hypothetical protein
MVAAVRHSLLRRKKKCPSNPTTENKDPMPVISSMRDMEVEGLCSEPGLGKKKLWPLHEK